MPFAPGSSPRRELSLRLENVTARPSAIPSSLAKESFMLGRASRRIAAWAGVLMLAATLPGCGINSIPTYQEAAKARWSEVLSQYKRRADLIPNLIETVKGFAAQEQQVLTSVTEARAKAVQVQVPADIVSNPEAMKRFQDAQNALG